MIRFFRRLWQDRRGNALVIGAACLPLIVGAAGLASDTIQWTLWQRELQRAADSAAIAGVYDRSNASGATTTTAATVTHDLTMNLHSEYGLKTGYPIVSYPDDSGVQMDQVKVTLAIQRKLPFSSMFMSAAPTIIVNSTAASIPSGGDACIEALETGATTGVTFTGNATVYSPDCDIFSNSSGTNVTVGKGSADVTANSVGGVGGIQQSNNFHVTAYRPYSPALPDPFSGVDPDTSDMHCAVSSTTTTSTVVIIDIPETGHWKTTGNHQTWVVDTPAVTHTATVSTITHTPLALTDGVDITTLKDADGNQANCFTSLSVGSNKSLTNIPANFGPIFINGGSVNFQGNFTCVGCSIVLTNKNAASPIGNVTSNASANVNITAPTDGDYKGIAIYQDRRATDCSNCNKINGNSASIITGAIYFPSQEIEYNGTGTTDATCTMFVARRVTFSGNNGTSNKFKKLTDCADEGLPSNSTTRIVRLVA
jgi:Flp pilus assembly protein TadG